VLKRVLDRRLGARGVGLAATCVLAAAAVSALVGPEVLLHPAHATVGRNPSSDFQIMTWSLEWWPWALRHGVNPFYTHLLWAPGGFPTLWMTSIPVPALLAIPLTLTAGPLVAYNALMLAAVVLAAAAAFLLCYELTGGAASAVLGALVFGLSPYMLGHTLSEHLDLTFVFPLPLLALLCVRYVRGNTGAWRFVASFAVLLLILIGSSLELFVDLSLIVTVVALLALAFARSWRRMFLRVGALVGLAYAVCLPVLVPIAILGLAGSHGPVGNPPSQFAVDLLNVIVPTPTMLAGALRSARAVSGHFVGNVGERDGYVGLPLLGVSLLTLRAEARNGAWIGGLLVAVAFLLSLGPTLAVGGHPLFGLPFAVAHLPLLGDTLPARMSLFVTLGLSCLCALWFARPGRRSLRLVVGALVVFSLFPNFWPQRSLPHAWASSTAFAWSSSHTPTGFVGDSHWPKVVKPGSNVLVLPTRDRTTAGYWQVESRMRFRLAVPETPFVPPTIAADPTVARLVDNVLPQLEGRRLGAARLRAFLLADHVDSVVVTRSAIRSWLKLVRRATAIPPVGLNGSLVFRVRKRLEPLVANGEFRRAHARSAQGIPVLRVWVHFDGARGRLGVLLGVAHSNRPKWLSSAAGDAEAPSVAAGREGRAAVVFTEWLHHQLLLRVATHMRSSWRVATLDRSVLPIWSQRVTISANGTVLAVWIDEVGSHRKVIAAELPPGGSWRKRTVLDEGDGLGSISLASGRGDMVVAAWSDSLASEAHIRVAIYANRAWHPVVTLAKSLALLDTVRFGSRNAGSVSWRSWNSGRATFFHAFRHGLVWGKGMRTADQCRQKRCTGDRRSQV
jgi:hypothetical protein